VRSSLPLYGGVLLLVAVAAALCFGAFPVPALGIRPPTPIFLLAATAALRLIRISPVALTAFRLSSPQGLWRVFEATSLTFFGCASAAIGMLMRRSRDAEALAAASQSMLARHAEFLDKAQQPIFSWNEEGVITYWNAGAQKLYGFNREEVVGQRYRSLLGPQSDALEKIVAGLAREKRWQGELKYKTKGGREITVESQMTLVEDCSGRTAVLETDRDISDIERTEEALLRTNERLQQLAYAAAHDLQEPLRNLALTLDLLSASHASYLGDEGGALLHEGIQNARRMHRMVKDLRVYGRINDSDTEVHSGVDATEVIRDVLELLGEAIEESSAEIVFGRMPILYVERSHLIELFQHLIANSLKYRSTDAPLRVEISATLQNSEWIFAVTDNGIGFDQAYAEQIFGIFKRLHGVHQYEGTGMGLAICSLIVTQYSGRIWAKSKPGKGATFYFTLPAAKAEGI
jgi:PAS domain S-box-containing protein